MQKQSNIEKYMQSYAYQELLKEHSLNTYGIWFVRAEDTNCDFGGHHYQKPLGYFEGKLEDIIDYAVELPNFFAWGSGGSIELIPTPKKIVSDSLAIRLAKQKEMDELLVKITSLKKSLDN